MPTIVTAVFTPKDGAKQGLIDAFRATIPAVHAEPGCELYSIHDAEDGTITMIEKWTTREQLDAHGGGPAVAALAEAAAPFLQHPAVVTFMTPLPTGTDEQGAV